MVGGDERRPGDEEDVPAGLDVRLERPQHFPDPPPDRFRTTAPAGARPVAMANRVISRSVRRIRADQEWMGPHGPALLERREVLRVEHHEAATGIGRARPSDRQTLPTASPASGQDSAAAGGLHPGAEALGAMSLLGLVPYFIGAARDPLHQASGCWSVVDP